MCAQCGSCDSGVHAVCIRGKGSHIGKKRQLVRMPNRSEKRPQVTRRGSVHPTTETFRAAETSE